MKQNEYQCYVCGGIFAKGWSDEEAIAEHDRNFPGEDPEDTELVCDDCYRMMTGTVLQS